MPVFFETGRIKRMWPDYWYRSVSLRENAAFKPEIVWPALRVVIDPQLAEEEPAVNYLAFLRTREAGISVLTRCDENPPSRVGDYFVVIPEATSGSDDAVLLEEEEGGRSVRVMFSAMSNPTAAYNWALASGFDAKEARERQLNVEAAIALEADLYVTDNQFALAQQLNGNVFACTPQEAMSIVGLHQRLNDRLHINVDPVPQTLDLSSAEYVESWGLLPNALQLFAFEGASTARWKDLIKVSQVRLERCLRNRDQILARSIHPGRSFPFDRNDALVERVALNLLSMFDSLARAIKEALALDVQDERCGFTNKAYRQHLPENVKRLLGAQKNVALIRTIAELRNTIHHEALSRAAESDGRGAVKEEYVILPTSKAEDFRANASTLGTTQRWIVKDSDEYGIVLRAVPLIEDLMEQSTTLFETIVFQIQWPGAQRDELKVKIDDPGEWWMHFRPTVDLVSELYGLRPQ
ncbi:hypothetical protein M1D93_13170 [Arthrobacter sp. Z1-9]